MPDSTQIANVLQQLSAVESSAASLESLLRDRPGFLEQAGELWAGGFHTDHVPPAVSRLLAERGMPLSIHAAAAFGFADVLTGLLQVSPSLIHSRGGDGATPLHFARDPETARLLIDAGADLDARDEDHRSTPAQWRIGKTPEVTRYLLDCGAKPDIFLAAALGDDDLATKLISEDASCPGHRIGRLPHFPPDRLRGQRGNHPAMDAGLQFLPASDRAQPWPRIFVRSSLRK